MKGIVTKRLYNSTDSLVVNFECFSCFSSILLYIHLVRVRFRIIISIRNIAVNNKNTRATSLTD